MTQKSQSIKVQFGNDKLFETDKIQMWNQSRQQTSMGKNRSTQNPRVNSNQSTSQTFMKNSGSCTQHSILRLSCEKEDMPTKINESSLYGGNNPLLDKSNNIYTGSEERKVDDSNNIMLNSKSSSPNIRIRSNIS
jgi:hypothetical protein